MPKLATDALKSAQDAIIDDIREEILVLLDEWRRVHNRGGEMFISKTLPTSPQGRAVGFTHGN